MKMKNLMIHQKSKEELIELNYQLIVDNDNLSDNLSEYQSFYNDILTKKTYNPIKLLVRYFIKSYLADKQLNFNTININTMNKLSKAELIDAYNNIVKYENKLFPAKGYKDYYMKVTGVTTCRTCSNPMVRIHEDFQRIIMAMIKKDCPEVIDFKLTLKSGKYQSSFYTDAVPFYTISKIGQLINQLKAQSAALSKKGYVDQVKILNEDIASIQELYNYRTSALGSFKQVIQPSTPVVNVNVPSEELSVENEALNESLNEDNLMEKVAEHLSDMLNTEIKVVSVSDESEVNSLTEQFNQPIELPKITIPFNVPTTLQEAWELKLAGHKMSVIAQSMGTSHQALSKQFKINGFTEFND